MHPFVPLPQLLHFPDRSVPGAVVHIQQLQLHPSLREKILILHKFPVKEGHILLLIVTGHDHSQTAHVLPDSFYATSCFQYTVFSGKPEAVPRLLIFLKILNFLSIR